MPGLIPSPNLTLTITPPGGSPTDYTGNLAFQGTSQQMMISQNFGRQGDTATLPLIDDYQGRATPHFVIPTLSQVKLVDNGANVTLFAGVVNDPYLQVTGPNRNEWTLKCTDYVIYADNALIPQSVYNGMTADQIVIAVTRAANCGITARSIASGGFVAPGPTLAQVILPWQTLSSTWRTLAQLASSSTPYGWYVDENRNLHFFDQTTALGSGVTFTTVPTASGSYTQGHIKQDSQFAYEWDATTIRNKIIVQGANQTVTSPLTGPSTDTWRADGVTTAWPLRYTVSSVSTLTLNGTTTAITFVSDGSVSTAPWSVEQNAIGQWFLVALSAPSAGTVIKLWYTFQIPVIAQALDTASQTTYTGPNGGVFAEFISDTSLTTVPMALARAQREKTEYAFAAERTTFNIGEDFLGWVRAGWTFTYTNTLVPDAQASYTWGLSDTFLCVANSVTFGDGGYRSPQVPAVRV